MKRSNHKGTFRPVVATLAVLSGAVLVPSFADARPLQCDAVPYLLNGYLQHHYEHRNLTPAIQAQLIDQMIKSLDPSKTMLLQSDAEKLKGELNGVFAALKMGTCGKLQDSYKLITQRAKESEDFVRNYVGKNYKLDENVEVLLDPEKRKYAKDNSEKQELLKKMIHFQISNYLLADVGLEAAKKQLIHRYELVTKRAKERSNEDLLVLTMESFARSLDPHSSFLSRDALEDFNIHMQLSLEGIGASLSSQDGYTVIEEIIPGGGAERSKLLKPKDKIIAVAQEKEKPVSVIDMELRDVVKMIRGKKGTKVSLTILRQGETTERFEAQIIRDKIDLKDQAAKITYEDRKIGDRTMKLGVIDFPSFYGGGNGKGRSSYEDIKTLLLEAKTKKADGIVLDLSRNGGGLLEDAVKIAGLFIRKGAVVSTQSTGGRIEILRDYDEGVAWSGPLVILTSRLSASASEILAGALKAYGRAVVVGNDHTFGKGSVQVLAPLPENLGAMKVTTGMYFLPDGASTQHTGVSTDVVLPFAFNSTEVGEKYLDYSLAPRKIAPFLSKDANYTEPAKRWLPVKEDVLKKLSELSQKRVSTHPKFIEVQKTVAKATEANGLIRLAEIRKEALKEKKKSKKTDPATKEKNEEDATFVDESLNILVDLIRLTTTST